jgi:hypothetical protein
MLTAVYGASLGLLWLGDEIGEPYGANSEMLKRGLERRIEYHREPDPAASVRRKERLMCKLDLFGDRAKASCFRKVDSVLSSMLLQHRKQIGTVN